MITLCRTSTVEQPIASVVSTATLLTVTESLRQTLVLERTSTKSYRRRFYCMSDTRPSAAGMGVCATCIIAVVLTGIIILDLGNLLRDVKLFWKTMKSCCRRLVRRHDNHTVVTYMVDPNICRVRNSPQCSQDLMLV
jgi:hypothetical protein